MVQKVKDGHSSQWNGCLSVLFCFFYKVGMLEVIVNVELVQNAK